MGGLCELRTPDTETRGYGDFSLRTPVSPCQLFLVHLIRTVLRQAETAAIVAMCQGGLNVLKRDLMIMAGQPGPIAIGDVQLT